MRAGPDWQRKYASDYWRDHEYGSFLLVAVAGVLKWTGIALVIVAVLALLILWSA